MSERAERDRVELTPGEVRALMDGAPGPILIDCREQSEWRTARIEGARLVPLGELGARADDLAAEAEEEGRVIVVHCHHGVRSLKGAMLLRAKGVDAKSMAGGIDRWSKEVDPGVPRY